MATAGRLCGRALRLADEHDETFPSAALLRNAANTLIQPGRLGVVGWNGSGKTSLLNNLIHMALANGDPSHQADGGDKQPGADLLEPFYGDWDGVQAAMRDGELMVQYNTRSQPDPVGARHLQVVEESLADVYKRTFKFGRQKNALLLAVGRTTHTTTQGSTEVCYGREVACFLVPRKEEAYQEDMQETLTSLLVMAQGEGDLVKLRKNRDFNQPHAKFTNMTGIDVVSESKATGRTLASVVQDLQEQSKQRSLLRPALEKLITQLKPCAFIGLRQQEGSDLRYVKDVLEQPLQQMVQLCCGNDAPPPELLTVDVLGMVLESTTVTVPCEMYRQLHLLDMPGLNDTRPWANHNISKAIGASTDLLLLPHRSLAGDETTLQCLINSGWAAEQLDRNARGHLIVCHNPERFTTGLSAEELWSSAHEQDMQENHASSREVLAEWLLKVAPPQLSEDEQRATVERFLDERCHFVTVAAANCMSLMLANPQDVFEYLQSPDVDVEMGAEVNRFTAYERLLERTQVAKLQEILGTISSFQTAQHMGALKDEVERQHQNLKDSEGTAEALTEDQAKKFGPLLKAKLSDPAKLESFVAACTAFHPNRRGQDLPTMKAVADALEDRLLAGPFEGLEQYYRDVQLSDDSVASMANQIVELLQGDARVTLSTLRRICKSSAIAVANALDIRATLHSKLVLNKSPMVLERPEEVLQLHREAAAAVAGVMKLNMGTFSPNEELVDFLKSERVWGLLVGRIEDELLRVADNNVLKGEGFDEAIGELLRSQLSAKLTPLGGYDVVKKFARKNDFWEPLRAAIVSALKAVREQLPQLLMQRLQAHVHNELFHDDRLFVSVRSRSHGLARQEMGRQERGGSAHGAQEQAGDAADSAAQAATPAAAPAAAAAATPGGRRSRAKKGRSLKEQYERQASLWRALHRFVRDAHAIVVGQEAHNAQRRKQLEKELEALQAHLAAAVEMYSGRAGYEELRRQMGRSLLHTMLQHKSLAQVLANSPEVSVRAEPLAFEVQLVQLPGGGYAVQGRTFTAALGDLALPAGLQEDFEAMQLLSGTLLQQHRLMWRKEHPIPAGRDNALKAGYSCLTGRRLNPDSGLKKVRDIVAKQMFEEGEELGQKLERAGLLPAPVGQQQPLAYILDFADGALYAGLLELQELASACLKEDEAFLVWCTARQDGGRFRAYLLPATPLATSGPAQCTIKAFPLMLFGGMVDGVVRPVFEPLFKAPRELLSLGAPQASQLSQGEGRGKRARTTSGTLVGDSAQPALSTASGEAGPSTGAAPGGAQRSVSRPTRAVRWKDVNEVASILCGLAGAGGGPRGPPDASDEAGPSKRARR